MVKTLYDGRLATDLAGLHMKTPVTTASGTFGFGLEFTDFLDLEKLGAVTVKGTTLAPRAGNKGQRMVETPSGILNCVGLENPGSDYFLETTLPKLRAYDVPVIVNIAASSPEEYGELAAKLDVDGVDAIEINVSCPNVKDGGMAFGTDAASLASVVRQVRANTRKVVITKLSPNVTSITDMARAAEEAGSDALSLINTLLGMKIDIHRQRPVLGNVTGGLSGPAIRPVAVRMVYQWPRRRNCRFSAWAASAAPTTPWSSSWPAPAPLLSGRETSSTLPWRKQFPRASWRIWTRTTSRPCGT